MSLAMTLTPDHRGAFMAGHRLKAVMIGSVSEFHLHA
jgi:hypothetical protein